MILEMRDSKNEYIFKLNGLVNTNANEPIYLNSKDVQNVSREKMRKTLYNIHKNPESVLKASGMEIVRTSARIIKARPYNPIELE